MIFCIFFSYINFLFTGIPINKFKLKSDVVSSFSKYSPVHVQNESSEVNSFEQPLIFGTQSGRIMVIKDC